MSVSSKLAKACFNVTWTLDTSWTSVHVETPTQNTCAHCQGSTACRTCLFPHPRTFRPREPHIIQPFSRPSTPCNDRPHPCHSPPSCRRGTPTPGGARILTTLARIGKGWRRLVLRRNTRHDDADRSTDGVQRRARRERRRGFGPLRGFGSRSRSVHSPFHGRRHAPQPVLARESVSIGDQRTRESVERTIFRRNENAHDPRLRDGQDRPTPFQRSSLSDGGTKKARP